MSESVYLNNSTYNYLKRLALVSLPGVASLYFVLWLILDLPAVEWVLGTFMLVIFVLGLTLQASLRRYYDTSRIGSGEIVILEGEDGKQVFSLELADEPENLINLSEVRFQIRPPRR